MTGVMGIVGWRSKIRLKRSIEGRAGVVSVGLGGMIMILAFVSRVYGRQFGRFPELGPLVRAKFVGVLWTLTVVILAATVAVGMAREQDDWLWKSAPISNLERAIVALIERVGPAGLLFLFLTIPATLIVAGWAGVMAVIVGLTSLAAAVIAGGIAGLWWRTARARWVLVALTGAVALTGSMGIAKWGRALVDAGSGSALAMASLVRGQPWAVWPGDWVATSVLGGVLAALAMAVGSILVLWPLYQVLWATRTGKYDKQHIEARWLTDWTDRLAPEAAATIGKEIRRLARSGGILGHMVIALAGYEICLAVMRPVPGLEGDRWTLRLAQTAWLASVPLFTLICGEICSFVVLPVGWTEFNANMSVACAPDFGRRMGNTRMAIAGILGGLLNGLLMLGGAVRIGAEIGVGVWVVVVGIASGSVIGLWAGALAARARYRTSAEAVAALPEGVLYGIGLMAFSVLIAYLGTAVWWLGPAGSDMGKIALGHVAAPGWGACALFLTIGVLGHMAVRCGRAWASAIN